MSKGGREAGREGGREGEGASERVCDHGDCVS